LPLQSEIKEYNATIEEYKREIEKIEKLFKLNNTPYSCEMVIEELKKKVKRLTKKDAPKNVVFEFIQQYIDDHKDTREVTSLKIYKSLKNHLQNYCKHTGKKVTFENIDYAFFQSFQKYLLQDKKDENGKVIPGLNNTSVAKQLSTVKTFLNYARKQGVEVSNKYKDFTIKREPMEVIALTNDEFERLYNMDLSNNKRLDETRDVFCFACATGLRYSDLDLLRREHIKEDEIKITVKKTKTYYLFR
jgi:site-specific recombinase XerD